MIVKFKKTLFQIRSIVHPNYTKGFFYVSFLGLLMAFFDLVGISFLFYVISLVLGLTNGSNIPILSEFLSSNSSKHSVLMLSVGFLFVLYLLKNIFVIICNRIQLNFAFEMGAKVSQERYHQIIQRQATYFSKEKSTDIMNEIVGAGVLLPENIIIPTIIWVSEALLIIAVGIALAVYNLYLLLFLLIIFVPAIWILLYFNQLKVKNLGRNIHQKMPHLYDNILQLNRGIEVIKLWNSESHFSNAFQNARNILFKDKKELQLRLYFIPVRVFEMVALFGVLALVTYSYFTNTTADIANLMAVYAAVAFRILPSINRIVGSTNQIISHQYVFDHFTDFETANTEIASNIESLDFKENIELQNIHFKYESEKECLQGISLKINKGEILGIQGKNGEGKTTLLKIICGLIEPNKGQILLDGMPIHKNNLRSYYQLFSYVGQDVFLIQGTIRDNIIFFHQHEKFKNEDEKMFNVLQKVGLDSWLEKLPAGLDSDIGEWGKKLSGGQKQRLAIARALYKDTKLFIFDEITTGLDAGTVQQLLKLIKELSKYGKTIVISSHIASDLDICHKTFQLTNNQLLKSN